MTKIFGNWKVVLLSFIGATTFWFFTALNKNYDARISYPVEFLFDRDSVVIMEPLPSNLRLDVSSGGWNLLRKTFWFNVPSIQILLDEPVETSFLTREDLLPYVTDQLGDLRINFLVTDTLFFSIEEKQSKRVKLRIDSLTVPLEGNYRVVSPIIISPDSVVLTGPESFIDSVGDQYFITLSTGKIDDPFDEQVEVSLPNRELIQSSPQEVKVLFGVERFDERRIKIPVEPINFPSDSSRYLSTREVEVVYTVARSEKEKFSKGDFAITADYSMFRKKDSTVMAMVMFYPEQVVDIRVVPENIKVTHAR